MGLMIYSLENIPITARRDYFVYLLDYGWSEPISDILHRNFEKMSNIAAENKAVVIKGTVGSHFQNEVLSWHHINGEHADDLLPALLITNKHPQYFIESDISYQYKKNKGIHVNQDGDIKMILIPFKKTCKNESDVTNIIHSVFNDIKQEKDLANFCIAKQHKKGIGQAIVDSIILEPNISGIGFSFNNLKEYFSKKD